MWTWKQQKETHTSSEHVVLYINQEQVTLLTGNKHPNNQISITATETVAYNTDTLALRFQELTEKYNLKNNPTTLILSPTQSELFSLESLPVEDAEIHDALKWKLKDLLNYPVETCCWDYFQVPSRDLNLPLLYVVATPLPWLSMVAEGITAAQLTIKTITISPLVMKNLLTTQQENQHGVGLLYEEEDYLKLIIVKEDIIYLFRQFDSALTSFLPAETTEKSHTEKKFEDLALFLQRSFDYYQSQLHQAALPQLFVTASSSALLNYLKQNLTCHVEQSDLHLWLHEASNLHTLQANELILFSALLQYKETSA